MREPSITDTVLSVLDSGLPLAVQCGYCPRRVLIRRERLATFAGNYRICELPLVCSCGSKDVKTHVLETPDAFIESNSAPGLAPSGPWRPTF